MRNVIISIIIITGLVACDNQEQVFPDYDFQAVYFPFQTPLRTLSLGEDRIDNTLDRDYQFDIGVSIGGMYENKQTWTVDYVVDPSLTDGAYREVEVNNSIVTEPLFVLPENYYTLSPTGTVEIPAGSFNGLIRVQLTEDFFNDPLALTGQYVIPLLITGTSADSILSGKELVPGGDKRVPAYFESGKTPKDWVLYGIKYVNAYHGNYLHRGMDITYVGGVPTDTTVYSERDVENDLITTFTSTGLLSVTSNRVASRISRTGRYSMALEFASPLGASGPVTVKPNEASSWPANGTGEFFDLGSSVEKWTGLTFQSLYLDYSYNDGSNNHQVHDTLVFRDRGIKFEENTLTIH